MLFFLWKQNLFNLEEFIVTNNKLPSNNGANRVICKWVENQVKHIQNNKGLMQTDIFIRNTWKEFVKKYEKIFISKNEKWRLNVEKVETYLIANVLRAVMLMCIL